MVTTNTPSAKVKTDIDFKTNFVIMRASLFLLCLLLLSSFMFKSDTWVLTKVSPTVSVSFPSAPQEQKARGQQAFFTNTGQTLFMVNSTKMPDHMELTPYDIRGVLMGAVHGIYRAAEGKEISNTAFSIGKVEGREISYLSKHPETGKEITRSARLMVVNRTMFVFHCWFLEEADESEQDKRTFFDSIRLNP